MKKFSICLIIEIIFTIVILVVNVYLFGSAASGKNGASTGDLNLQIQETRIDPATGQTLPYEGPIPVMPGVEVSKIVTVRNAGCITVYVRIYVEKQFVLAQNAVGTVDTSLILLNLNDEYWFESDGYYYYCKPLAAGDQTEPLFTCVKFAPQMDNLYQGSQALIQVKMEAVQSDGNGPTVMDAVDWPSGVKEGGNA